MQVCTFSVSVVDCPCHYYLGWHVGREFRLCHSTVSLNIREQSSTFCSTGLDVRYNEGNLSPVVAESKPDNETLGLKSISCKRILHYAVANSAL